MLNIVNQALKPEQAFECLFSSFNYCLDYDNLSIIFVEIFIR